MRALFSDAMRCLGEREVVSARLPEDDHFARKRERCSFQTSSPTCRADDLRCTNPFEATSRRGLHAKSRSPDGGLAFGVEKDGGLQGMFSPIIALVSGLIELSVLGDRGG